MYTEAAKMPSISVVIPAFNEAGYISETLERLSAAEQHLKGAAAGDIEILVVDNTSTDATAEPVHAVFAFCVLQAPADLGEIL